MFGIGDHGEEDRRVLKKLAELVIRRKVNFIFYGEKSELHLERKLDYIFMVSFVLGSTSENLARQSTLRN